LRDHLDQLVRAALAALARNTGVGELADLDPGLERARDPQHGDFASNVAMRATKLAGKPPRELAQALVECLPADASVAAAEIAGPGFINFRLTQAAWQACVREILARGTDYGTAATGSRGRALIEYVSANPTGPLHVGHGRHAAYGATLAAILRAAGYSVDEEYYINDAGRQMDILAASVWLRYAAQRGADIGFPPNAYKGDYVTDIAGQLADERGDGLLGDTAPVSAATAAFGDDDEHNIDALIAAIKSAIGPKEFAAVLDRTLNEILGDIRNDLEEFGVRHSRWFSERSLTENGAVAAAIRQLREQGQL
jgi:arginyl-tRNA synthetase